MQAKELLRAGHLDSCLEALQGDVKADPASAEKRADLSSQESGFPSARVAWNPVGGTRDPTSPVARTCLAI